MGLSSKTSTTTSNGNYNGQVSPTLPPWASQGLQMVGNNAISLDQNDPSEYVAGPQPDQTQAASEASNLGSTWQGDLGQATTDTQNVENAATPQIGASTIDPSSLLTVNGGINSYLSPYLNDVVNSSMATYNQQAGQQTAALEAQGAQNGAFGGDRFGLAQGELGGQIALGAGNLESGLLNTGYNNAVAAAESDASLQQSGNEYNATNTQNANEFNANQQTSALQRQLAAAAQIANLGGAANQDQIADIQAQDAAAQPLQAIAQAKATAPIALTQATAGILQGITPDVKGSDISGINSSTSTTTTNPSTMDDIGQGIGDAADIAGLMAGMPTSISAFAPQNLSVNPWGGTSAISNPYSGILGQVSPSALPNTSMTG